MSTNRTLIGDGPVASQYLNSLAITPIAILSLKKLWSTATVSIRVRRSSDSTEQDIGFSGDALDTASLLSFVGSGSGFIRKWYDQTGNGFHAEQATTTKQPRIVNAGVYDGGILPDGSDDFLKATAVTAGTPYMGQYSMISIPSFAADKAIVGAGPTTLAAGSWLNYSLASGSLMKCYMMQTGVAYNSNQKSDTVGIRQRTLLLDRSLGNTTEIKHYSLGSDLGYTNDGNGTDNTGNFPSTMDYYIGADRGTGLFGTFLYETLVWYNASTGSIRSTIEAKI